MANVSSQIRVLNSNHKMNLDQSTYMRKSHNEGTKCNVKRSLVGEYNSREGRGLRMTWGRLERYLSRDRLTREI